MIDRFMETDDDIDMMIAWSFKDELDMKRTGD